MNMGRILIQTWRGLGRDDPYEILTVAKDTRIVLINRDGSEKELFQGNKFSVEEFKEVLAGLGDKSFLDFMKED